MNSKKHAQDIPYKENGKTVKPSTKNNASIGGLIILAVLCAIASLGGSSEKK